ncbi:hypothetical protein B566_EDAN018973 [Ephemera danica]|nr:hypothetical protein B566_EDAN018973 [Ephemera danica]
MGVLRVGILGAGVVGLNTALELQREFPTAQYTILAERFTTDTTSDGAAGLFRPASYFSGPDFEITKRWIADSYEFYDDLRKSGRGHETGIFEIGGYVFSNYSPSTVRCRLMEGVVPLYRAATQDELDNFPEKWKYDFDVLVNCTGLGSRILCNDIKTNPIRGQVIKVRAPWIKQFYMNDYDGYIIPNRDTITLGGCRHFGSYDLRVSAADKQTIMSKCKAMQPSLERAEFVRDWVGLRPHRDPVRVELVYNYGHGGYGVTSAPGTAKHAVKLLRQQLSASLGSVASKL